MQTYTRKPYDVQAQQFLQTEDGTYVPRGVIILGDKFVLEKAQTIEVYNTDWLIYSDGLDYPLVCTNADFQRLYTVEVIERVEQFFAAPQDVGFHDLDR